MSESVAISDEVLTHLTEVYSDPKEILFGDGMATSPTLAMAEARKERTGMGRKYVIPITTYEGAAVASDPAVADAILDTDAVVDFAAYRWEVAPADIDAPFKISRSDMLALEGGSKVEQFDTLNHIMRMATKRIRNMLALAAVEKGDGYLAQASAAGSTYITVDVSQLHRFPVGAALVASITRFTDVLAGSPAGARLYVTGHDAANPGRVTLSGDPTSVWANDQDLFIFRAGMRIATDPADAESAKIAPVGLLGWINPSSTTFMGVTRTNIPALTGINVDCSGLSDTNAQLIRLVNKLTDEGRPVDSVLVSSKSWELLNMDNDAAKIVDVGLGEYKIGFAAYKLPAGPKGITMVMKEPKLPQGYAVAGPFQNKEHAPYFGHSGAALVNMDKFDGKELARTHTSGNRDYRGNFFFRGQYIVPGPGNFAITDDMVTS